MHRHDASGSRPPARFRSTALVAFATFLSYVCGGCLANEYVIPKAELARLMSLPPEQRGESVHVVQRLGRRRSDAIEVGQPSAPPPPPPEYGPPGPAAEGYVENEPPAGVGMGITAASVPQAPSPPPRAGGGGWVGPPVSGPRGPAAVVPAGAASPAPRPTAGNFGKVSHGSKDSVTALLIVFAVLATLGLIAEGVRYDGTVAMYPWQGIHLKDSAGREGEAPLVQITPTDVAATSEAVVMDDEGWGLRRLGRAPLDRRGFTWKMSVGTLHSPALAADGVAADIQFGYFPHRMVGIVADWSPAGGSDVRGNSFYRHNLALAAQVFPLSVWRLHLGGFAHGGVVYADDTPGGSRNGAAFGGGGMLELALTARLALMARFDYTTAKVAPSGEGWQGADSLVAGIAVY